MDLMPLPSNQSTLRRPDGKLAHIDMILIPKGFSAATGAAAILNERRATPHWPVLLPLTAGRVMVPVLVPAKAGSTDLVCVLAPAPSETRGPNTALDMIRNEAASTGVMTEGMRMTFDGIAEQVVRQVHDEVSARYQAPSGACAAPQKPDQTARGGA